MNVLSNHINQTQRLINEATERENEDFLDVEESIKTI